MKRYGMTLSLKEATIEAYKEYHRNVWPEVEAGLKAAGILQMTIFILGSRLFMYAETEDDFDWSTSLAAYEENPRCAEWQRLMASYQEPVPEARPGEWWAMMAEVHHLEV